MLKVFESLVEFAETYEAHMAKGYGGIFFAVHYQPYKKQTFWDKLRKHKREIDKLEKEDTNNDMFYYGIYLARVIKVRCLCMRINEVDIDYLGNDGEKYSARVKIDDLYHYDWPADDLKYYYKKRKKTNE